MPPLHDFGIPSAATIAGHPIHPMLVPLPIGLLLGALLADLVYAGTRDPFWASAGIWLTGAGTVGGVAAAAAGLADFLGNARIRELHHAWYHLAANALALLLAVLSLVLRVSAGAAEAVLPLGLIVSAVVVALLTFAGWHGGEMVFRHGVGMSPHEHGVHGAGHD